MGESYEFYPVFEIVTGDYRLYKRSKLNGLPRSRVNMAQSSKCDSSEVSQYDLQSMEKAIFEKNQATILDTWNT